MGLEDIYSDYGSGSSSNSSSSLWLNRDKCNIPQYATEPQLKQRSSSYLDLKSRCTLDDVMLDFKMNGVDSPYNPDEDRPMKPTKHDKGMYDVLYGGMGPPGQYLRQHSWPAANVTPPTPKTEWLTRFDTSTPIHDEHPTGAPAPPAPTPPPPITEEQIRFLHSLPDAAIYSLLRAFRNYYITNRVTECRFCKNNGECASFYRSHSLRSGARVTCPVLRALRCARCGARGDHAHTAKYCPLATEHERQVSIAIMQSIRKSSGRRRAPPLDYHSPSAPSDERAFKQYSALNIPLDPRWAALEQKLKYNY